MPVKVAINGFGRIGRLVFRAIAEQGLLGKELDVVAVGDIVPADNLAYLLKYDSTQGRFQGTVESRASTDAISKAKSAGTLAAGAEHDILTVNGKDIRLVSARTPAELPWKAMGVDLVIESTGLFTEAEKCKGHLVAGAKKVVISAPGKGEDITIVMGVNQDKYDPANHHVISNASCTTNCVAPMAKVLDENFGIVKGLMTTVHAYTNDQRVQDLGHPDDLRRARAAGESIIPTTTGAAKAVSLVLPELKGKMHGFAMRVPVANVSVVDLVVDTEKNATVEEVNAAFKLAAASPKLSRYLAYNDEELVSKDYNHNAKSSTVDALSTMVMDGNMLKVVAWYDNEWGYSNRVVDLARMIAGKM